MKPAPRRLRCFTAALLAGVLAAVRAADRAPETPAPAPAPATGTAAPAAAAEAPAAEGSTSRAKVDDQKSSNKKKAAPDAAAAKAPSPVPLSPRFQQVRDRIKVLYGNRDNPPPPIDGRHNPFRSQPIAVTPPPTAPGEKPPPANTTAPGATPAEPAPPPVSSNVALVKQAAALLKVTGFVERDGRTLLNINQALYREGETIKVAVKGQSVLLRIKKLSRTSLTVVLGEAEHTINF